MHLFYVGILEHSSSTDLPEMHYKRLKMLTKRNYVACYISQLWKSPICKGNLILRRGRKRDFVCVSEKISTVVITTTVESLEF